MVVKELILNFDTHLFSLSASLLGGGYRHTEHIRTLSVNSVEVLSILNLLNIIFSEKIKCTIFT